jgi:mannose-6-phosphate isomerase-like protein (cupin superfamily)
MQNRRRKRKTIDPKTLKKHTSIVSERLTSDVVVLGFKEETKTGYMIPGYSANRFVTFFEVMLPGSASGKYVHEDKERTVRVLAGQGFVIQGDGADETQQPIGPGDEVAFKPRVPYKLSTTSITPLEMFVAQDKNYGVGLEVLEPAVSPVDLTQFDLEPNERPDDVIRTRGPSKAAQQQTALRGHTARTVEAKQSKRHKGAASGIVIGASPMPGGPGQFNEAEAG